MQAGGDIFASTSPRLYLYGLDSASNFLIDPLEEQLVREIYLTGTGYMKELLELNYTNNSKLLQTETGSRIFRCSDLVVQPIRR